MRDLHMVCNFTNFMRWTRSRKVGVEFERRFPHFASDVSSALFRMDIECLSNWYADGRIKLSGTLNIHGTQNQPLTAINVFVSICLIQSKCKQGSKLM